MSKYAEIAEKIGSVGGEPVTEQDVRQAMRAKSYVSDPNGDIQPIEMARLARDVKHAKATRIVAAENEKNAKGFEEQYRKTQAAKAKRSEPQPIEHDTMEAWRKRNRISCIMAKHDGASSSDPVARAALEEFRRGPMWLR